MDNSEVLTDKNHKWIYTYDYAPDSLWEPWRDEVYPGGKGLDEIGVPLWIGEEADDVAARVRGNATSAAPVSRASDGPDKNPSLLTFLLLADSHYTVNGTWEDTVSSMKAVADRIPLSGIIHLGDLTDGLLPLKKTREAEKRCIADMESFGLPLFITPGNHDYNYFRGNPEIKYPGVPQYYIDFSEYGLRFFFIDSFDPKEPARYGFTDYCIHWLDAVLKQMPKEYRAVICSHLTPLVRLQAWTKDIRNRNKLMEVLNAHADRILAFLNGHNHCDQLFNELNNGMFPLISINCAKCEYFKEHKPEGAEVPFRKLGDRTQGSFDIMQINAEKGEIFLTRFGAGNDRYVKDHKAYWN